MEWLISANRICGGRGFAHSWSPIFGWKAAYPETTGYLIPTLLRLHEIAAIRTYFAHQNIDLEALAVEQGAWLMSLQLPGGAFPGLLAGNKQPSVFNTGMILSGLHALHTSPSANARFTQSALLSSLNLAEEYLRNSCDSDGLWRKDTYVPDYTPAYHVYALAKVADYNQTRLLQGGDPVLGTKIYQIALQTYLQYWNEDGSINDCGFWKGKSAYTHTIAYALHGLWHCGKIFRDSQCIARVHHTLGLLLKDLNTHGKLAGAYWPKLSWFSCPTGDAQLAKLLYLIAKDECRSDYHDAANQIMYRLLKSQKQHGPARGALPGSIPFYGPYMRFRYPNWAVKYFLDALIEGESALVVASA
jgi:hypothetical protein